MSLHQGLEQLFPSHGEHKVRERLIVPLDVRNFLDVELDYVKESEPANDEKERTLTPDLIRKTEAVNDGRGNQQVALFELTFLHFGFASDIESGDGGCWDGGTRIFHATSTMVRTSRLGRLTGVNIVGFLLGLREGIVRVQALESGCAMGKMNET